MTWMRNLSGLTDQQITEILSDVSYQESSIRSDQENPHSSANDDKKSLDNKYINEIRSEQNA